MTVLFVLQDGLICKANVEGMMDGACAWMVSDMKAFQ